MTDIQPRESRKETTKKKKLLKKKHRRWFPRTDNWVSWLKGVHSDKCKETHERCVMKSQTVRAEETIPNTFRQKKAGHLLKIRNQHGTGIFNSNHGFWDPVEHCLQNSNHFKPKVLYSWQQGRRQQKDGAKWGLKMLLGKELKKTSHRGRPTRSQVTLENWFCFHHHKGNADQDYNVHVVNSSKDWSIECWSRYR